MAEIRERLFHWQPRRRETHDGPIIVENVTITAVLNDADVDIVGGESYRRVLRYEIDGNIMRGGNFRVRRGPGQAPYMALDLPDTLLRTIVPPARITEQDLGWDFTPTHEDVRPGSVSNPSLLTSGGNATASASDTTAAFTPTANSLLVVGWSVRHNSTMASFSFSNTHAGSGAWAVVNESQGGTDFIRHNQARCQMGASPGSGTITNTYTVVNPQRKCWIVAEITGHDTTTPLSESNIGKATTGTALSIALAGIAAGNLAIGTMAVQGAATVDVGTGETELAEVASGGAVPLITQMEYGADATVNWSWTGSEQNLGVAVEYAQAGAGEAGILVGSRKLIGVGR